MLRTTAQMNISLDLLTEKYVKDVQLYVGKLENGSAEFGNNIGLASLQMDFISEALETENTNFVVINDAIDFSIVNLN